MKDGDTGGVTHDARPRGHVHVAVDAFGIREPLIADDVAPGEMEPRGILFTLFHRDRVDPCALLAVRQEPPPIRRERDVIGATIHGNVLVVPPPLTTSWMGEQRNLIWRPRARIDGEDGVDRRTRTPGHAASDPSPVGREREGINAETGLVLGFTIGKASIRLNEGRVKHYHVLIILWHFDLYRPTRPRHVHFGDEGAGPGHPRPHEAIGAAAGDDPSIRGRGDHRASTVAFPSIRNRGIIDPRLLLLRGQQSGLVIFRPSVLLAILAPKKGTRGDIPAEEVAILVAGGDGVAIGREGDTVYDIAQVSRFIFLPFHILYRSIPSKIPHVRKVENIN